VKQNQRDRISDDLPQLGDVFGWGEVEDVRYLADGLMNRNWRVQTSRGTYALKQILDVPLATARRNLGVVSALAEDGVPACPPQVSRGGDLVVEVDGRGYCLIAWVEGVHRPGTELSLSEVTDLGVSVGRIHQRLGDLGSGAGLPAMPAAVRAKVTDPAAAVAEADRFLGIVSKLEDPGPFDKAVPGWLEQRKLLLEKYGAERPAGEVPKGPFGWTHGDLQYRNILWRDGRVAGVVDWDRIRVRPLGEEVARTAQVQFGGEDGYLDLDRVAAFVAGYRTVISLAREDLADAVDRLWWKRMSDFWQLEFHYDRGDHGPDHLYVPSERLLDWWTSRREEVQAAFTAGS
jgi:homoserine kinase type II